MRVALYLRVSTDDKGQTVENQRSPLKDFCHAQDWSDVHEYADEASATDLRGRRAGASSWTTPRSARWT